jgi:hypothetical protein
MLNAICNKFYGFFEVDVVVHIFLIAKYKATDSETFVSRKLHVLLKNYLLHREKFLVKIIATEFVKKLYWTLGFIAMFATVY